MKNTLPQGPNTGAWCLNQYPQVCEYRTHWWTIIYPARYIL